MLIFIDDKTSASGIFGVIISASGIRMLINDALASSSKSLDPLVETITGSKTIFFGLYFFNLSAIVLISSELDTIPIFTASGNISSNIHSSSFARKSCVTSLIPYTPVVFCAVSDVMALIP